LRILSAQEPRTISADVTLSIASTLIPRRTLAAF
jgi:hypothetical protein